MKDWYDWGVKVTSRRTAQANNGRICLVYNQSKHLEQFVVSQRTYLWRNPDLYQFAFTPWGDV